MGINVVPWGRCRYCKKEGPSVITYFKFPINCNCCSRMHHERVIHCPECKPVMPKKVEIVIAAQKLLDPIHEKLFRN